MTNPVQLRSEISHLKSVIVHRPGKEIEHLTPDYMERLLFDDLPYLPVMQKEHDVFVTKMQEREIEVLYLEELVNEAIQSTDGKAEFAEAFLRESKNDINGSYQALKEYLHSLSIEQLVRKTMEGVLKTDLDEGKKAHLDDYLSSHYPFYLDPMPNLYFTRDPACAIANGVTVNKMDKKARRSESLFIQYIIQHHPRFAAAQIPIWLNRDYSFSLEGGDVLVLNEQTVAIGISERTSARAIERLALNLLSRGSGIKKVIAIEIPKKRAFMHLDTVFTMVDHDQFTIHPAIEKSDGTMNIYVLEEIEGELERVQISRRDNLLGVLKEVLSLSEINLIPCGGGDIIVSPREQWNDGSNTLAIAPGVVITYDRNQVTNTLLQRAGIEVIEVPSSELSRGRGGPRCMSMPLQRK